MANRIKTTRNISVAAMRTATPLIQNAIGRETSPPHSLRRAFMDA